MRGSQTGRGPKIEGSQNKGVPKWEGSQNEGIPKNRGPKLGIPSFPETCPGTAPGLWDPFFGIPPLLGSPPGTFGIPPGHFGSPPDLGIPPGTHQRVYTYDPERLRP